MHLIWNAPPSPLRAVEVSLTVLDGPAVPELYFWAVQVSFVEGSRLTGAAHLGLQHHPGYPGSGAANWGGYHRSGGQIGGRLSIPSALGNPNTGDYAWAVGVEYRLRIAPASAGWRGSVTDMVTGVTTVIRDLAVEASALAAPLTWSEVFAPCDAPAATVRWSRPVVETEDGRRIAVESARVHYQSVAEGGCTNGSSLPAADGIDQSTAVERVVQEGAVLRF